MAVAVGVGVVGRCGVLRPAGVCGAALSCVRCLVTWRCCPDVGAAACWSCVRRMQLLPTKFGANCSNAAGAVAQHNQPVLWRRCMCWRQMARTLKHTPLPRRFTHIPLVASLAGGLSQFRDSLGVALVDAVLEDIR